MKAQGAALGNKRARYQKPQRGEIARTSRFGGAPLDSDERAIMGTLIVACLLDALIFCFLVLAFGLLLKRLGVRATVGWAISFVLGGIAFLALFMPLVDWFWSATIVRGDKVTLTEYRGTGVNLPPDATNITFYMDISRTEAVFDLPEASFVKWADNNKWELSKITTREQIELGNLQVEVTLEDGLIHSEFDPGDGGFHVAFDRAKGICYYRYCVW